MGFPDCSDLVGYPGWRVVLRVSLVRDLIFSVISLFALLNELYVIMKVGFHQE